MRLALAELYKTAHLLFKAFAVVLNLLGRHHRAHIRSARRVADIARTAADKRNRAVACHLQSFHKAQSHKMTYMKAVCRGVKAYIKGSLAVVYKLSYFILVRNLRYKPSGYKFVINFQ